MSECKPKNKIEDFHVVANTRIHRTDGKLEWFLAKMQAKCLCSHASKLLAMFFAMEYRWIEVCSQNSLICLGEPRMQPEAMTWSSGDEC
ncbi:hypothetical protein N7457_008475 [Penicillium paradoxum]|uniref:uncharacterized protein n=1 Tax=Penicillium paradoxum TaxID=176176 RepID=UPI002548C075|nr:uncharacterized protein N7457_008475 [Penicillium paradoxum]KAJ5773579.1 hypothetical protein N7457_008475 [Penicillium paradoxum]